MCCFCVALFQGTARLLSNGTIQSLFRFAQRARDLCSVVSKFLDDFREWKIHFGHNEACYILTFCYSKASHRFSQNPNIHKKHLNEVLCDNMNMDAFPKGM